MIGFWDMGAKKSPKLPPVEPRGHDTAGGRFEGCLSWWFMSFSGVQSGPEHPAASIYRVRPVCQSEITTFP
jgi:hypothetical protein